MECRACGRSLRLPSRLQGQQHLSLLFQFISNCWSMRGYSLCKPLFHWVLFFFNFSSFSPCHFNFIWLSRYQIPKASSILCTFIAISIDGSKTWAQSTKSWQLHREIMAAYTLSCPESQLWWGLMYCQETFHGRWVVVHLVMTKSCQLWIPMVNHPSGFWNMFVPSLIHSHLELFNSHGTLIVLFNCILFNIRIPTSICMIICIIYHPSCYFVQLL